MDILTKINDQAAIVSKEKKLIFEADAAAYKVFVQNLKIEEQSDRIISPESKRNLSESI